jgi:hypothetical protein
MADHDTFPTSHTAGVDHSPAIDDYQARRRTYQSFLRVVRYCILGIAIILIVLAWLY